MTSCEAEEIKAFLTLNRLRIDGRRRVVMLLTEGKSAQEILKSMEAEDLLKELPAAENAPPFDAVREMEFCGQKGIDFLVFSGADYPLSLKEIADPPLLLYKKGVLIESDRNAIAIVGTRHPSFYGRTQAKKFSQELAAKGLTIVSGGARGVDQVAHDGALQVSYGRTIAVMGCGLDVIYPKEHEELFGRIARRGAVLSEYPLGTPPLPENFPRRNRILSGLSYATFVVEAHSRSGSLITAHQAAEQGREVFALPGPVDQLTSRGTHQLIKEGACLVEAPGDILMVLADRLKWENQTGPGAVPDTPVGRREQVLNDAESSGEKKDASVAAAADDGSDVIEELLKDEGPLTQDEILEFTGLDPARLPVLLLRLELSKKLRKAPDGRYAFPC